MLKEKRFEYFSHTADAKFRAYGKNIEEQFSNAAIATFNIMFSPDKIKPIIKKEINLEAKRTESLLYDWIDELLFHLDSKRWFLSRIDKIEIKDNKLHAIVFGDDYKNYNISGHVKGVTYSEMEITKEYVQIVLDM